METISYPVRSTAEHLRTRRQHPDVNNARRDASSRPRFDYQSVDAVLNDLQLGADQKRAILSSWASDLFAVESCPWLRQVPGIRTALRLSDILAALRSLDDDPPPRGGAAIRILNYRRRQEGADLAAKGFHVPRPTVSAMKSIPKAIYRTADEIERRIKAREEMRQSCRPAREGSSQAA